MASFLTNKSSSYLLAREENTAEEARITGSYGLFAHPAVTINDSSRVITASDLALSGF